MTRKRSGRFLHIFAILLPLVWGCDPDLPPFQGFGVFLGALGHLAESPNGTVARVVERVYSDLGVRQVSDFYQLLLISDSS